MALARARSVRAGELAKKIWFGRKTRFFLPPPPLRRINRLAPGGHLRPRMHAHAPQWPRPRGRRCEGRRARVLPGAAGAKRSFHTTSGARGTSIPAFRCTWRKKVVPPARRVKVDIFKPAPPIPGSPGKSGRKPSLRIAARSLQALGKAGTAAPCIAFARSGHAHRARVPRRGRRCLPTIPGANAFGLGQPAGRRLIHTPGAPGAPPAAQDRRGAPLSLHANLNTGRPLRGAPLSLHANLNTGNSSMRAAHLDAAARANS